MRGFQLLKPKVALVLLLVVNLVHCFISKQDDRPQSAKESIGSQEERIDTDLLNKPNGSHPSVLNIGIILSRPQRHLEDLIVKRMELSKQVKAITAYIVPNPIEMSRIICSKFINSQSGGVVAVMVDTDGHYIDSIATISFILGLYNIPVIGTTLRDSSVFRKDLHSSYISLIPPRSHQADVWNILLSKLQLRRAFILTSADNRDLMTRFVDLIDRRTKSGDGFKIEAIVEYDETSFHDTSSAWAYLVDRIKTLLENSICRVFLIHAQSEADVKLFVGLIDYLGLSEAGFVLIFSEDTVQLAEQHNITLPSGILATQLSLATHELPSSSAYVMDAVDIILKSIPNATIHEAAFKDVPNSCNVRPSVDWILGIEIYANVLQQSFFGRSGYISFDENGDRFTASYNLLNLVDEVISDEPSLPVPSNKFVRVWRPIGIIRNGINESRSEEASENNGSKMEPENTELHKTEIQVNVSAIQWPGNIKGRLVSGIFIKRHLQIITLQEKPFVWSDAKKDCWNLTRSNMSDLRVAVPCRKFNLEKGLFEELCCTGYCMELLLEIAHQLNFTFDLYLETRNLYGSLEVDRSKNQRDAEKPSRSQTEATRDPIGSVSKVIGEGSSENGHEDTGIIHNHETSISRQGIRFRWTGIIGELVSRKFDMAFAPLTITPQRAVAIDFSKPFKFHGFCILLRRAPKHTTLASFLQPFHNQLWVLVIGVATHVVAISLYLLDRYSTLGRFGMKKGFIPTTPRNSHDDHPLHLSSSVWFSWSILLNSGVGEHTPKSLSGRVLGIFWSGFAMIVVASYTANLAAFLVLDSREETPTLSGIDDPRLRSGDMALNFATVKGSAVDAYLQSQVEYINLYRKMEEFNFDNVDKLISALQNGTIDALVWDSTRLEWEVSMDEKCSLGIAGESFGSSGYGIGLQRDSYWTKNVTTKLLELHESGFMIDLDKKWISSGRSRSQQLQAGTGNGAGGNCERHNEDYPETLGIFNIAGVFILFACGLLTSFGLIILERLTYKHRAFLLERKRNWWRWMKGGQRVSK